MKKILTIIGTRPEVIKMAPVLAALKSHKNLESLLCTTGQHIQMVDQMLDVFNITADFSIKAEQEGQFRKLSELTARLLIQIDELLDKIKPNLVLVHGDTTSTLMAALASFYKQIPVGHIEAGLRTSDAHSPFPEEMNRRLVSRLATLHFAPTPSAVSNLNTEHTPGHIYLVGNTIVDSLKHILDADKPPQENDLETWIGGRKLVLVTCHRRESWGIPIDNLCDALAKLVAKDKNCAVIWPVHGNPLVAEPVRTKLEKLEQIKITQSLRYDSFVHLLKRADIVLTDSGGVLEETATLGRPVLVLRKETERPEALEYGTGMLVWEQMPDLKNLISKWLAKPPVCGKTDIFGNGDSGKQIAQIITDYLA